MRYLTGAAALSVLFGAPVAHAEEPAAPLGAPAAVPSGDPAQCGGPGGSVAPTDCAKEAGNEPDSPLPPDLQKMLDAAIASGNEKDVDTIARYIAQVAPDSAKTVTMAVAEHKKARKERQRERLASQRFFDAWKGEGQFGAFQSSGNTNALGVSLGLSLEKEGLHWRHKIRGHVDYQRSDGVVSRNQMKFSYEPNRKFDGNMFVYGLAQFERDPFQGFEQRYSISGGLGSRLIDSNSMTLDVKAGPAWRFANYTTGPSDAQLSLLTAAQYKWRIARLLTFTQSLDAVLASGDKTVNAVSALDSKLGGGFSARLSWQLNYESDPADGAKSVDTLSRVTLVYGF
ncbi:DUF481 domain-containing protein [Novosphingobium sp. ZN18A2]|uniref:DUF481 domain-containing protein n=1 Tax=Novosphingobium sp. ZN18A2 TaxID=3079861 RepID=UPI0030CEC0E1